MINYKDLEKRRESNRKYREKNRDKLVQYGREWRFKKFGKKTRERKNSLIPSLAQPSFALGYILGSLWGDGWITRTDKVGVCGLQVTDKDFSDFFREQIKSIYPYHLTERIVLPKDKSNGISKKSQYHVSINSKEYTDFLNHIECRDILLAPIEMQLGVLRGLYDSEGNVSLANIDDRRKTHRSVNFFQKEGEVLELVSQLLTFFEIRHSIYSSYSSGFTKNKKYFKITIQGLSNFIKFKEKIGFSIKRKSERLDMIIKSFILEKKCKVCGKIFKIEGYLKAGKIICDNCSYEYWKKYQRIYHRERYRRLFSKNKEEYNGKLLLQPNL